MSDEEKRKVARARKQRELSVRKRNETPAVLFEHVTKTYPAQPSKAAINDISIRIGQGEFVFIVGHSGSGKSTFIRTINREIVPDSGKVIVGGQDVIGIRESRVPYLRRNIGCVFQDFKLLPNKTAFENVAFAMECVGKSRREIEDKVPQVLQLVGLDTKHDKRPSELSGGEQQRVSIARAIINQPPLLICDEPTGNLDPQTSRGIMELLLTINKSTGTTVIVATHDQDTVNKMRQRVVRLDGGRMISDQMNGAYIA